MPGTRKRFIDPKTSQSFQVIHRSQKDPLISDDEVNQLVLLPIETRHDSKKNKKKKAVEVNLPDTLLPTVEEEEVGLLNLAAPVYGPRPDLDPDVVAGLDEDFNFSDPENQLEDNFLEMAGGVDEDKEEIDIEELQNCMMNGYISDGYSDGSNDCVLSGEDDDFFSKPYRNFGDEETKSQFTDYSLSSSVLPRTEALQTLDERFEKFFDKYNDTDIGALDGEDIQGFIPATGEMLLKYLNIDSLKPSIASSSNIIQLLPNLSKTKFTSIEIEEPLRETCESIAGTSNSFYHPHVIKELPQGKVKLNRYGVAVEGLKSGKLTLKNLKDHDKNSLVSKQTGCLSETLSQISLLSVRPKNETPEERRDRKKTLKSLRQERRQEKKANSMLFQSEKYAHQRATLHNKIGVTLANK